VFFRQILDEANGCASYMIGCAGSGDVVVVDPLESVGADEYVLAAADRGMRIVRVIETHLHADHASAARTVAEAAGAPVSLHEGADVDYAFEPLREGDTIAVGNALLQVLHTPGHTPESISLLVFDAARSRDVPWLVLTGDSLLVGDVARPDLVLDAAPDAAEVRGRARTLYRSVHDRLAALPEGVEVFPGHFGASACGGRYLSAKPSSTIGFERAANAALRASSEEAFIEFVLGNLRPQPEGYRDIKRRNMGRDAAPAVPAR